MHIIYMTLLLLIKKEHNISNHCRKHYFYEGSNDTAIGILDMDTEAILACIGWYWYLCRYFY